MSRHLAAIVLLVLSAFPMACGDDESPMGSVRLRGVVFGFASGELLEGARVSIAELPELATTSAADGTWELEVPDGARVTPVVELPRHPTMYLETFTTDGVDLERVNFQLVPEGIYRAFGSILGEDIDPVRCQIASTVNVAAIGDLSFEQFRAYGPHGVAGATVETTPSIGSQTVYFTEQTLPDRTLTETTIDGGVVWANVAPGTYELRAVHPERTFRPSTVTCEPGRFINAGPPWG
ncbi:MAG: hypothetical protein IT379_13385, partial [Deltaproteobacteria bacterium]|nr:hypothetical protein [Deltaproteobacteria bacterium]